MNKSIIDITPEEIVGKLKNTEGYKDSNFATINFDGDIAYLMSLANVSEKWNLPSSHRGNFTKTIFNFLLKKLFFAIKIFMNGIINSQELFNKRIIDFLRHFDDRINEKYFSKINALESTVINTINEQDNANIDYFDFENKFRGTEIDIKNNQEPYIKYFEGKNNILDIGCGRGEFLNLLKERSINATGIDIYDKFIQHCKKSSYNVHQIDAIEYLKSIPDNSLDGIACFHVIEHLNNKYLVELLTLCHKKLKNDCYAIFESPNPKSLSIFANAFYIDISHKKPIHPFTLEFLLNSSGFNNVNIEYKSPMDDNDKLKYQITDNDDYKRNIDMLNNLIYGPQDYGVIAKK